VTTAVRVAVPFAVMVLGAPVIATEMVFRELEPPPHPATTNAIARYKQNFRKFGFTVAP
jgi:hypothetical protein